MSQALHLHYDVPGDDFTRAGEASGAVKRKLKQMGFNPSAIRRVAIAMYEGEINMVIHAGGGEADVDHHVDLPFVPVSYTHLDVYKRQGNVHQRTVFLDHGALEELGGIQEVVEKLRFVPIDLGHLF